jgi:uncharacterized protein YjiS (DUF1127 family)
MSTNENCHYFWVPTVSIRLRRVILPDPGRVFHLVGRWLERAAQRRRLGELEDRMLKDIGVSRAEAYRESSKWFWQG